MKTIIYKFKQLLSNISLKRKILYIVLTSILLIAGTSLTGIYIISASYLELLHNTVASNLSYSATTISYYLSNAETMSGLFLTDTAVQQNLASVKHTSSLRVRTEAYKNLTYTLSEYYQQYKPYYLNYLTLINPDFITYSDFFTSQKTPETIHHAVMEAAKNGDGRPVWISCFTDEYGLFMGRLIKNIQSSDLEELGTLVVSVDLNRLMQSLNSKGSMYKEAQYYITVGDSIIYNENPVSRAIQENSEKDISAYELMTISGHKYFVTKELLEQFGWTYVCYISYDQVFHAVRFAAFISMAVILFGILAAIFISESMISFITRHTNLLISKMEAFSADETTVIESRYDYSFRKDEFGLLNRQFDQMAEKIRQLIQVNYVNELWKKDARLKALEMQMNPHFLYNTLESVNWRAKASGNSAISDMVKSLGLLLRSTLSDQSSTITLKRELEVITAYMTIQTYRFEDRLEYEICCAEPLSNAKIPKMSIQPLVENAINYGLEENTESCSIYILIELCKETNILTISVQNNGSFFEKNLLEKLRSNEVTPHGFGIGLINVEERIKLMFGKEFGLILSNKENLAIATIKIPYMTD